MFDVTVVLDREVLTYRAEEVQVHDDVLSVAISWYPAHTVSFPLSRVKSWTVVEVADSAKETDE